MITHSVSGRFGKSRTARRYLPRYRPLRRQVAMKRPAPDIPDGSKTGLHGRHSLLYTPVQTHNDVSPTNDRLKKIKGGKCCRKNPNKNLILDMDI